jgi:HK97 family phage major capsid protein
VARIIAGLTNPTAADLRALVEQLDREHAGELMPDESKEKWNSAAEALLEFENRERIIAEMYGRGQVESSSDSFQTRRPSRHRLHEQPRPHHVAAAEGAGLRAIDMHSGELSGPAGVRLEQVVRDRERDPQGIGGRYLAAVGDPDYFSAFGQILTSPLTAPLTMSDRERGAVQRVSAIEQERAYWERGAERAMSLTTTSGGFAVPFVLDPTVMATSSGAINPYRAIANVEAIAVDEWRGVSSDGITAAFGAEAAVASDNSPTLAQPVVSTEKAFAFVPFSIEIGQDWGSFAAEMAGLFSDAKDVLEATKMALGSGTNEPFGVITGATTVFTCSNTSSLVVADIYGVHNALGPRFRSRATWTFNNAVADRIRQLDTAGGANLWIQNLQLRSAAVAATMTDGRMGADLLGKPVYEATAQSGTFTTGQLIGVIGDYSRYFKVVDRIGAQIELVQHLFGAAQGNLPTGQRGLYMYFRVGSKVIHANAFRTLKLA